MKTRFVFAQKQAELDTAVNEMRRKMGISDTTFLSLADQAPESRAFGDPEAAPTRKGEAQAEADRCRPQSGGLLLVGFGVLNNEVACFAPRCCGAAEANPALVCARGHRMAAHCDDRLPQPVGEAMKDAGEVALLGDVLTHVVHFVPPYAAVGLVMATAMLFTPLLHHAAAVLVLSPAAAALAANLGYCSDAFMMAVARGCPAIFSRQSTTITRRW